MRVTLGARISHISVAALMCSTSPRAGTPRATGSAAAAAGVHSLLKKIDNSLKAELAGDAQSDYPNQETREVVDAHWVEVRPIELHSHALSRAIRPQLTQGPLTCRSAPSR